MVYVNAGENEYLLDNGGVLVLGDFPNDRRGHTNFPHEQTKIGATMMVLQVFVCKRYSCVTLSPLL